MANKVCPRFNHTKATPYLPTCRSEMVPVALCTLNYLSMPLFLKSVQLITQW